jgi:threonine dehydratase
MSTSPSSIPTPEDVAAAAERLDGVANRTPVMTSRTLNEIAGCEVFLKCENLQRVGAFKFRGAYNAISQLTPEQKAAGVITHSSGNHAQGVALAAQLLDVPAVIVMPEDAPPIKRAATADYGAEIVTCSAIERENVSAELAEKHGYTLIHPYDNPQIIAGQGTAAWELFAEVGPLDTLFVPVGGGGLISGSALAAAHHAPDCRVVGVEPALADDANRSWRQGEIVTLDHVPPTVADGLRTRFVGEHNLAIMSQYVTDMTTVTEEAIMETLEFIWTRLKIIVEPSAAVALAPLFSGAYREAGQRVGVIFSGGNVNVPACGFFHQGAAGNGEAEADAGGPPGARSGRPRVLVCDAVDEAGLEILRETADLDIDIGIDNDALLARMGDYEGIIVGRERRVTGQMIEYGFHLRAIACVSSHLDHIDVSAARAMGI